MGKRRVRESRRFILALLIAFFPAAIIGLATHRWITARLFTPAVVVAALIVGGVVILAIEHWRPAPRMETVLQIGFGTALIVVRWLIRFVSHRSFDVFAWYRIGFGLLLLMLLASGQQWMR